MHFFFLMAVKSIRKNLASQDSPPVAGRVSDIYISAAVRSLGEIFI